MKDLKNKHVDSDNRVPLPSGDLLRDCEERYCLLSENTADIIWTMDRDFNITFASKSVIRLLDYTPEEVKKADKKSLLTTEAYKAVADVFKGMLRNTGAEPHPQVLELEHIKKDGSTIWAEMKVSLLRDTQGEIIGLLGITRDITDRRNAEDEKKKLELRLLKSQPLEAIGTLAGGVAHDFNNILTTILGYCELLMKDMDAAHPFHNDLKQIRLAAGRGESLVKQLLIFSSKKSVTLGPVNINAVTADILKMLYRLIGEDIAIVTDLACDLWSVHAETNRIEQIIMNLAINARDAMPGGGKLTIKTNNSTINKAQCAVLQDAQPGNFVCLTVSDSGTGIAKGIQDKIFEPFFTTKPEGEGAGLGLFTVYGIVAQHKGWINVQSEPGGGTEFKIYFPALEAKPVKAAQRRAAAELYQGNHERILLVEDDAAILDVTARTLIKNSYTVFSAASAEEALDLFEREGMNFHLVISDVVLPGKNGVELVAELLRRKQDLRVILCSGYTDDKSHWHEIRQKGYRFLHKPYALVDLLKNIRMAIQYR